MYKKQKTMSTQFSLNDSLYVNASSGNVGIGITNPSKTLEVVGDIDSTTDYNINGTQVLSATTLGSTVVNSSLTSNTGNLTNNGSLTVSSTAGNIFSTLNASMNDGTSQWVHFGKALSSNDSAALGFKYSSGSSAQVKLGFNGNASDLFVIQENGKIGIGSDTPAYELDVSGDINLTGDLYIDGVAQSFGGSAVWSEANSEAYYMGNVGIGTNDPARALDVITSSANVAVFKTSNTSSASNLTLDTAKTGTGNAGILDFKSQGTSFARIIGSATTAGSTGDLVFQTSGSLNEAMRIDADGNVGIGATPSGVGNHCLHLHENSAGGDNWIQFTDTDTGSSNTDGFIVGITGTEEAQVRNRENTDLSFWTNDSRRMTIDNDGNAGFEGNVGIGTNSPQAALEIYGGTPRMIINSGDQQESSIDFFNRDGNNYANWADRTVLGEIRFMVEEEVSGDSGDNYEIAKSFCTIQGRIHTDNGGTSYGALQGGIGFYTNDGDGSSAGTAGNNLTEKICIDYQGQMGIGTSNPTALLHVNGSTKCAGTFEATGNGGFTGMVCAFPGELSDTSPSNLYFSFGNGSHAGYGITMVKAGKVIGISMSSNTNGCNQVELYKNGSATGVIMNFGTFNPPNNELVKVDSATFGHSFAANDALALKILTHLAGTITAPQCCFWVKYT